MDSFNWFGGLIMAKDPRFNPSYQKKDDQRRTDNKIVSSEVANGSILSEHLANGSITVEKLASGLVSIAVITDNAITTSKILNGAVTPQKLSSNWPIFYAWAAGGLSNTVTGAFGDAGKPIFNETRVNDGSYNITNGRFTAPTDGIYEFNFAILHRYSTAAGRLELTFYINGTNASPRSFSYSYVTGTGDHDWVDTHAILSLTAGQYVQCGVNVCGTGTNYYYGENLGYFSGKQIR